MYFLKIFISSSLLLAFQFAYSQKEKNFDFDKFKVSLKKENVSEADKIKTWLLKSMTINESRICTKNCSEYLSNIPDDITLGLEEKPGTEKKAFYKKWSSTHDMNRIPGVHPFELGNGGCSKSHALNPQFIGSNSNGYFFNVTIYCDNNKNENNKLILKIVTQNGKYLIDDVMSQTKADYFA
jgi:hypothetical protein